MPPTTVCIVGAGAAGLATARACVERGLEVTLFDSRPTPGGLWFAPRSPVFQSLTTNTACFDSCFSDIPPPRVTPSPSLTPHDNLCLTADELRDYLRSVPSHEPRLNDIRVCATVTAVREVHNGYDVEYVELALPPLGDRSQPQKNVERFDYVIVSTGMHNAPLQPTEEMFPGLGSFPGTTLHVSGYKEPAQFRGKRVLVVGGSISGSEAAADMATAPKGTGPVSVVLSTRAMRHMCVKQNNGRVFLGEWNSRFLYLQRLAGRLWDDDMCADLFNLTRSYTRQEEFNAPPADGPIKLPGLPNFLPINQKVLDTTMSGALPWNVGGVRRINSDGTVAFMDGTVGEFDVLVFSTGYQLNLPFLDYTTLKKVLAEELPGYLLDLADFSFHPELPRLAFVGLYGPGGAAFPIFDSQARWVAKVIARPESRPSRQELWDRVKEYRRTRRKDTAHVFLFSWEALDRFAELGGFDVNLSVHKEWTKALIFGPLVPAQFRLFGEGRKDKLTSTSAESEGGTEVDTFEEFERQMTAGGFVKGDNKVEPSMLKRLVEICDTLTKQGNALKGLKEAVDYLVQVNSA